MSDNNAYIADGLTAVTTYLCLNDASGWVDWVQAVFGATVAVREPAEGPVRHARVVIDGASIEVGGVSGAQRLAALHFYVPDCDATTAKAVEAGATEVFPIMDHDYGERGGGIEDPYGVHWYIATAIR